MSAGGRVGSGGGGGQADGTREATVFLCVGCVCEELQGYCSCGGCSRVTCGDGVEVIKAGG